MDIESFKRNFSMPLGGPMYAEPPYPFRGVQDLMIRYEADSDAVNELLPPHLEPADDPVICTSWSRWVPFSAFGPYHEAFVMVDAKLGDTRYMYQPSILVDNDIPLGAGREIWGYAKKIAVIEHNWGADSMPYMEQLLFTVERPRGQRLMTASMVCDRKASPDELAEAPVLSYRHIPSAETAERPSVSELVRLDVEGALRKSGDGSPELYAGRAALTLASTAADSWHQLAPVRILGGFFAVVDFDLNFGRVVHDYLKDPAVWG
ncbi:MAG: acetoacetate decarboxylase family protein [Rhodospirillales bacterium]|nr:acetoacetate decarboxylase family protein [Rhodospirillales bacterium]